MFSQVLHRSLQLAAVSSLFLASPSLYSTAITGDDETVESTPTPRQSTVPSTTEKEPTAPPPATPANTPEVAPPTPAPTPVDPFQMLMRAAEVDLRKRNLPQALKQVEAASVLKPDSVAAINLQGAIFSEMAEFEKAAALYRKALVLQPDAFWPAFNLAEVDFIQRNYARARKQFQELAKKLPGNELLQFKIMLTYLEEKNDAAARAELDKMPFPSNSPAYYFAWAAWEFRHGNPKGATEWMSSGVQIFGKAKAQFLYSSLADLKITPLPKQP